MSTVIKVENLSKQYRLGTIGTGSMAHDINRWFHIIRGKGNPYLKIGEENDRSKKSTSEYVWALRDINFDVKHGDILGIIGRNGAGKSTLLKILSRTTSPTTGSVKIKGRVASLLEVGTGFHPELTGRENVFLNGAIMGMTKTEITKKFDEIVDFSGVEKYIDTPVKRYSSGMYVRLAFAVAAYLESEILIVDEVLAVGDAEFQKKCLGKMGEVSKGEGRTVLFVSHNLNAVSTLTVNSIFLANGKLIAKGRTSEIITKYLEYGVDKELQYEVISSGNKPEITKVTIKTSEPNNVHINGQRLEVAIEIYLPNNLKSGGIAINFVNRMDDSIVHTWLFDSEKPIFRSKGVQKLVCAIDKFRLYLGHYSLVITLAENSGSSILQRLENVCPFKVEMYHIARDYEWHPDSCTYIEDFEWSVP